jgi:hypothetical protein
VIARLDLLVIAAAVIGGAILIEQRHRVTIEPPIVPEAVVQAANTACPDNDNVPYSAGCISFMQGRFWSGVSARAMADDGTRETQMR